MSINNTKGFAIGMFAAAYELFKLAFNVFIMHGGFDVLTLLIGTAAVGLSITGLKYGNYVVAALLALIALTHLPANISNISSNWVYLIEGIIDIGAAVLLCVSADVKEHFANDISDIGK